MKNLNEDNGTTKKQEDIQAVNKRGIGGNHKLNDIVKKQEQHKENFENVKLSGQNSKKDTVLRMFYNNGNNFAEVFNKAVFAEERIHADELQELDSVETGMIDDSGKSIALHQERDIIKKLCDDKELMLFAIENSTYIDYTIPIKVLNYCCVNYNRQVMQIKDMRKISRSNIKKEHEPYDIPDSLDGNRQTKPEYKETSSEFLSRFRKNDKIHGIVTLLIYYGEDEWDGPLSLCDMMNLSDRDKEIVSDYKILHFIDVMRLTPEQLEEFEGQVKILLGFLRYQKDSTALEEFIIRNSELMNMMTSLTENTISNMCNIGFGDLYKEIFDIRKKEEEFRKEFDEMYREEGGLQMNEVLMEIVERARQKGVSEGKSIGINEGQQIGEKIGQDETRRNIISNMMNEGLPIDKIALLIGLSINDIENYIK